MLVVGLATPPLRISVVVELASLFFDLRLTAKEHALRAYNPSATVIGKRCKDMENESVVAVRGRRRPEGGSAAETSERVFETLLPEDLFLELVLLLLVV